MRISAILLCCLAGVAHGQESERTLPKWEAGIGAFAVNTPAYPGTSERSGRFLVLPHFTYRGEVIRSDRGGIGARLINSERIEFDIGFAGSLPARSKDKGLREGMPDLGTLVEFGPRLRINLAKLSQDGRLRLELPARQVIEARGGLHRMGYTFEPRLVAETSDAKEGWGIGSSIGTVFGDTTINRYFYDVAPQYATATRSAYQAKGGLMLTRVGLSASYKLNRDVRLYGYTRYDSTMHAANSGSPLLKEGGGFSVGIGVTWYFARSSELARP